MTTAETVTMLRCWRCNRLLAEEVTPPYRFRCPNCHALNQKNDKEAPDTYTFVT